MGDKKVGLKFNPLFLIVPVGVLAGAIAFWPGSDTSTTKTLPKTTESNYSESEQAPANSSVAKTIRTEWKAPSKNKTAAVDNSDSQASEALDETAETDEEPETLVSMDVIYQGLQDVKISEDNEIIIDETALLALNRALYRKDLVLSEDDLSLIKNIITESLPSPSGTQAAEIVENYYQYLQAHEEFNELNKQTGQVLSHEEHYQELNTLRELYLGQEVASQLFAEENKNIQYMHDLMTASQRQDLSKEERQQLTDEINVAHAESNKPDIVDWDTRYADYNQQKQQILASGLTKEQESLQIRELKNSFFSADERRKASKFLGDGSAN